MTLETTSIGLAGEYHVLAQLAQRGFVGALTLSNTKAVDNLSEVARRSPTVLQRALASRSAMPAATSLPLNMLNQPAVNRPEAAS